MIANESICKILRDQNELSKLLRSRVTFLFLCPWLLTGLVSFIIGFWLQPALKLFTVANLRYQFS